MEMSHFWTLVWILSYINVSETQLRGNALGAELKHQIGEGHVFSAEMKCKLADLKEQGKWM